MATAFAAIAVLQGPTAAAEADHYVPDGELIVREHRLGATRSEESHRHRSFVVVRDVASGAVMLRRRFAQPRRADRIDTSVPPGAYRVSRFVRTCAAGCEQLGPRTERCAARVVVGSGRAVSATVRTRAGYGCTVRVHVERER